MRHGAAEQFGVHNELMAVPGVHEGAPSGRRLRWRTISDGDGDRDRSSRASEDSDQCDGAALRDTAPHHPETLHLVEGNTVFGTLDRSADDAIFVNSASPPLNLAACRRDQVELHILRFDSGQANDGFALRVLDLGYRQALLHQLACTAGEQKEAHGAQYTRGPSRGEGIHSREKYTGS